MVTEVGGPIYIGDTPGGESFPEYDSTIDKNQIVKNVNIAIRKKQHVFLTDKTFAINVLI